MVAGCSESTNVTLTPAQTWLMSQEKEIKTRRRRKTELGPTSLAPWLLSYLFDAPGNVRVQRESRNAHRVQKRAGRLRRVGEGGKAHKYPSPFPPGNNSRVAIREGLGRQPAQLNGFLAFLFGKLTVAPDLIAEGPSVLEILNG